MSTAPSSPRADLDALKRAAAEAAVQMVENDMVVGLGSGSTAANDWKMCPPCSRTPVHHVSGTNTHPLRGTAVGEIETEGLAIMAKDMGIECWGIPDLEIIHAKE